MCPLDLGFKTPLDATVIWRYMTLVKFERLVQDRALWFSAASSFPDTFEGTKAAADVRRREAVWDHFGVSEGQRELIRGFTDWNRHFAFANCWMMNTHESKVMWDQYADGTGVAIESTYARLRKALPDWILVYKVQYIDYERDSMIDSHSLAPAFYKRKEFEAERELRAVVDAFPEGDNRRLGTKPLGAGHLVEVDLPRLVTRVILSPSPTSTLATRVKDLSDSIGVPVIRSSLDKLPQW